MSINHWPTPDWAHLSKQFAAFTTVRTQGFSLAPYDDGTGSGGFNLADHVGDQLENVVRNRTLLAQRLPANPTWLTQVHGTTVLNLDEQPLNLEADACITTQPGVVCAVLTADCLPVLFCDANHCVVGAAHAGWRGLATGVLENTVSKMQLAGANPAQILAWLGPAIGSAKFEVGEEVRDRFIASDEDAKTAFALSSSDPHKFYADIFELARLRLQRAGVHQISGGNFCTVSEPEKFFSYRRDGITGRMASLIWMKK